METEAGSVSEEVKFSTLIEGWPTHKGCLKSNLWSYYMLLGLQTNPDPDQVCLISSHCCQNLTSIVDTPTFTRSGGYEINQRTNLLTININNIDN